MMAPIHEETTEGLEDELEHDASLHPEIQEARAMLEELFELVHGLDPDGTLSYLQLRDKSKMLRKLTSSLQHTIEAGGAPATATHIIESIVQSVSQYHTADAFSRGLTDPRHLATGSVEHEFYTHCIAGLKETIQRDVSAAA